MIEELRDELAAAGIKDILQNGVIRQGRKILVIFYLEQVWWREYERGKQAGVTSQKNNPEDGGNATLLDASRC